MLRRNKSNQSSQGGDENSKSPASRSRNRMGVAVAGSAEQSNSSRSNSSSSIVPHSSSSPSSSAQRRSNSSTNFPSASAATASPNRSSSASSAFLNVSFPDIHPASGEIQATPSSMSINNFSTSTSTSTSFKNRSIAAIGMAQDAILALDVGSSSIRCSIYDHASLKVVVSTVQNVRCVEPNTGRIQLQQPLDPKDSHDGNNSSDNDNFDYLFKRIDTCIDETLIKLQATPPVSVAMRGTRWNVVGVAISTFVMNFIGVDMHGNVLGPEYTVSYACNTPSVATEVAALQRNISTRNAIDLYQRTGAPLHSAYALAQLRVLYRQNDVAAQIVHQWQTISSLCLQRWMDTMIDANGRDRYGRQNTFMPISLSEASWTGLLNYRTCQYESTAVALLPRACQKALPSVAVHRDHQCYQLPSTSSYWHRWPELRPAQFFVGYGDGVCANFGSKCSNATRIACTIGTSAAARVVMPFPMLSDDDDNNENQSVPWELEPGLFCYRIDTSRVLVGGALTDGGSVVEWLCQLLNVQVSDPSFAKWLDQAKRLMEQDYTSYVVTPKMIAAAKRNNTHATTISPQRSTSSGRLTTIPFFSGERSTGFRTGATGAILGLTRETTPAHLLRSCLEGVTLRLHTIVQLIQLVIESCNMDVDQESCCIVASGAALEKNVLWRQMIADCTGLQVLFDTETREGTSRGAAYLVTMALQNLYKNHHRDDADAGSAPRTRRRSSKVCALTTESFPVECLGPTTNSIPQVHARRYWDDALATQERILEAISPLYNNNSDW